MKKAILLSLSAMLVQALVFAQQPGSYEVSGTVKDTKGMLGYALITLHNKTDSTQQSTFSEEDGTFRLQDLKSGTYHLDIELQGYLPYQKDSLSITTSTQLEPITLQPEKDEIKGVTITAQRPLIEVKPDKIIANIANSPMAAGNSVFDLLNKMPGVHIDNNDNVNLKGKAGVQIWIDGKPTRMGGQDLANLLRGMSSSQIDRIEIISNPGAQYDAQGIGGIINILTKRDKRSGINGGANLSYGQGVYPKYGMGGNISYRKNKLTINAAYQYNMRYWFNNLLLDRNFLDKNNLVQFKYLQDNYALFNFKNHTASASIDYALTSKTTLGMAFTGGANAFEPQSNNYTEARDGNNHLLYVTRTQGKHDNLYYNASANVSLRHNFDSSGRNLSMDADYAVFGNKSQQNFVSTYTLPDGSPYLDDYYMRSNLNGTTDIKSIKVDYTHPFTDSFRLDAGLKSSFVTSDNEPLFYQKTGGDFSIDSSRSNHFIYKENINAAYLNLNKDFPRFGLQAGLRIENTNASGQQFTNQTAFDTSYIQLFPHLAFQYHLNTDNDLGVTLSRRIERPDYQQLNPFKFFIDKTTYREGYPYLRPASYYSAELTHTYKQRFVTTLSYGINNGYIIEVIQPSEVEDSVTVQTVKNANRLTFAGIYTSYPFRITKWWNAYTALNIYYAKYQADIANTQLNKGAMTYNINVNNTFTLPANMSAELSLNYRAKELYGYMMVEPNWMLNAGIQKNFFNKKLTVKLNIQDIFFTGYPRATSTYEGYRESFVARRETRVGTLSFSYNFGNERIPGARRRGGAEEEKNRAGTGGA